VVSGVASYRTNYVHEHLRQAAGTRSFARSISLRTPAAWVLYPQQRHLSPIYCASRSWTLLREGPCRQERNTVSKSNQWPNGAWQNEQHTQKRPEDLRWDNLPPA